MAFLLYPTRKRINIKCMVCLLLIIPLNLFAATVESLNDRYNDTTIDCDNGTPAYYCSGVLVRGTAGTASLGVYPWEPSEHAIELGSVSFSYLRKDINVDKLFRTNGFLFLTQDEALASGLDVKYRCSFPYEADTLARPFHGCGTRQEPIVENCNELGVNTISNWLLYMDLINSNIEEMCSFSTDNSNDFFTSIIAHDMGKEYLPSLELPTYGDYNEILVEVWNKGQLLPIEAFWFIEGDEKAKEEALNDRYWYFVEFGIEVPVVSIDLSNKETPFIYEM